MLLIKAVVFIFLMLKPFADDGKSYLLLLKNLDFTSVFTLLNNVSVRIAPDCPLIDVPIRGQGKGAKIKATAEPVAALERSAICLRHLARSNPLSILTCDVQNIGPAHT